MQLSMIFRQSWQSLGVSNDSEIIQSQSWRYFLSKDCRILNGSSFEPRFCRSWAGRPLIRRLLRTALLEKPVSLAIWRILLPIALCSCKLTTDLLLNIRLMPPSHCAELFSGIFEWVGHFHSGDPRVRTKTWTKKTGWCPHVFRGCGRFLGLFKQPIP